MKKIISFLLILAMLMALTACGQEKPAAAPENTPEVAPSAEPQASARPQTDVEVMSAEEQGQLIESLKETWMPQEWTSYVTWYALTDLDHNGRLEVICATRQGTGLYTYAEAWEVSEDFSTLSPVAYELEEGESGPDLIVDSADCYFDPATGLRHYIIPDTLRLGPDGYITTVYAVTLENGVLSHKALASCHEEYSYEGKAILEYTDGQGNYTDEEQYNAAAGTAFAGLEKSTEDFLWTEADSGQARGADLIFAADLTDGSGYVHQQCDQTGVYDFAPVNSEGIEWQVYVLNEEFTDAERYISQAHACSLAGAGSLSIKEGQWIYVYCPCNSWTMLEPPEGCAFSWRLNPDKEYEEPAAPEATSHANEGNLNEGNGPDVVITKNPTGEVIPTGGNNWFIAHADNAEKLTWKFYDTGKILRSMDEAMAMNPGLDLKALDQDTLAVSNVPASFNGWSVVACFEGNGKSAFTDPAPVFVGNYLTVYSSVLNNYKTYLSNKNGDVVYTSLDQVFPGEPAADTAGVGVLAAMEPQLGYYLEDLNRDGTPELIIGARNEHSGGLIVDMFTVAGGQVKRVLASSDRCRYVLRADGYVTVTGSNGASSTGNYLLAMNTNGGMSLIDGVELNGENYYRIKDTDFDNSNDTKINQSEYQLAVETIHESEFSFAMKQLG